MSGIEEKSPYYSKDFEISTVPSPKEYIGFLKRSITIKYGNQQERVLTNPKDWADVSNKSMIDELDEQWDALTTWAQDNNQIFIDEIRHRKNYKDEILEGKKEYVKRGSITSGDWMPL